MDTPHHKCPTCTSTAPHMHPAVQHEGEVQVCLDSFHLQSTPENTPALRTLVLKERLKREAREWREQSAGGDCTDGHVAADAMADSIGALVSLGAL